MTFGNLILCIVMVILGFIGYRKMNSTISPSLGLAVRLFGIFHPITLLG